MPINDGQGANRLLNVLFPFGLIGAALGDEEFMQRIILRVRNKDVAPLVFQKDRTVFEHIHESEGNDFKMKRIDVQRFGITLPPLRRQKLDFEVTMQEIIGTVAVEMLAETQRPQNVM